MTLPKASSLPQIPDVQREKGSGQQLPVAVVMVFVIAAQGCQASQTNCIRKEDLSACIHPDLQGRSNIGEKTRPAQTLHRWEEEEPKGCCKHHKSQGSEGQQDSALKLSRGNARNYSAQ